MDFFLKNLNGYWQQILYGITTSVFGWAVYYSKREINNRKKNNQELLDRLKLLETTITLTLSDSFFRSCRFYIEHQKISIQELKNLEKMYDVYHKLGGNGVGTELYQRCKNLPLERVGDYNK